MFRVRRARYRAGDFGSFAPRLCSLVRKPATCRIWRLALHQSIRWIFWCHANQETPTESPRWDSVAVFSTHSKVNTTELRQTIAHMSVSTCSVSNCGAEVHEKTKVVLKKCNCIVCIYCLLDAHAAREHRQLTCPVCQEPVIDTHFERQRRRGSGEASNTARPKNHTAHHPHDEVKSHFVSKRTKRLSALTSTKLSDLKTFYKEQLLGQLAKLEQHIRRPRDFPPVSMANTRDEIAAAPQRCRQKVFQRKP